jgi:hypothetical protein
VTQKLVQWISKQLCIGDGVPHLNIFIDLFTGQPLPDRLWEMILVHSPNLVRLTIDGTCIVSQLWNIRKIFSGRWGSLRSLSLGNISSRPSDVDSLDGQKFLKAHPRLENLEFYGSLSGFADGITSMPLVPLPRLQSFTGKITQLKEVTGTQLPSLRSLQVSDYFSPAAKFAPILQGFPNVVSLSVCVNFLDTVNGSHQGFFERLLSSCPQLTHIEVASTSSFNLVSGPDHKIC